MAIRIINRIRPPTTSPLRRVGPALRPIWTTLLRLRLLLLLPVLLLPLILLVFSISRRRRRRSSRKKKRIGCLTRWMLLKMRTKQPLLLLLLQLLQFKPLKILEVLVLTPPPPSSSLGVAIKFKLRQQRRPTSVLKLLLPPPILPLRPQDGRAVLRPEATSNSSARRRARCTPQSRLHPPPPRPVPAPALMLPLPLQLPLPARWCRDATTESRATRTSLSLMTCRPDGRCELPYCKTLLQPYHTTTTTTATGKIYPTLEKMYPRHILNYRTATHFTCTGDLFESVPDKHREIWNRKPLFRFPHPNTFFLLQQFSGPQHTYFDSTHIHYSYQLSMNILLTSNENCSCTKFC
mmetsp:Transcript_2263/g.4664  ORF Transcript_2263/g.4664 Transcript_2263/m.4664 type:complete len:350 (-) Transcript_2263:669-1718(-)